jgi:Transposase
LGIGAASAIRCTASASCCSPRLSSSPGGDGRGYGLGWQLEIRPVRWPRPGRAELLRAVYRAVGPAAARAALDRFYRWCDGVGVPGLSRLARTVRVWEAEILAWHATGGCSNGPTEAVNLLIKQVKRVGHGFRNFANYRLRLLLHCGVRWQTHRTARLLPTLGGVEPVKALLLSLVRRT